MNKRAFTLLEVLVTLTLVTLVSAGLFRVVSLIHVNQRRANQRNLAVFYARQLADRIYNQTDIQDKQEIDLGDGFRAEITLQEAEPLMDRSNRSYALTACFRLAVFYPGYNQPEQCLTYNIKGLYRDVSME